jgi:hypothetical protein
MLESPTTYKGCCINRCIFFDFVVNRDVSYVTFCPEATIPKNDNAHACDVTPEDPTITKDIENQEHLDFFFDFVVNRDVSYVTFCTSC